MLDVRVAVAAQNAFDLVARLRVVEVDQPESQAWKRQRLRVCNVTAPDSLAYAPVDFERQSLREGLSAAGIDFEQPDGPDADLADGQVLVCGGLRFEVMHVPGHAPGLVAFTGHGVSFGGDLLFAGSIGRTDLPLGDSMAMEASLARYAASLADDVIVHPGHGPFTTVGHEKRTNPFLTGAARLSRR